MNRSTIKKISNPPCESRRTFIKTLGAGTGTILLAPSFYSCSNQYSSQLYQNFLNPSAEAKPFFRWWWNGNRLEKDELERELKLMHEAGIGGIEINPIQMPEQAANVYGREYEWLSDEWIELLEFTINKAEELGMVTDLIVGTGWPFGGEFLSPAETIQGLKTETIKLKGPSKKNISLSDLQLSKNKKVFDIRLYPEKINSLSVGKVIPFDQDSSSVYVDVPVGDYQLHILTLENNFRHVMHGAPGGAGPVLDHFNKKAVEKYLNFMSDKIKGKFQSKILKGIRAMFCDSIELNGANWTNGFDRLFKEKRGYEILPYLSLLLTTTPKIEAEFNDELRRARYDYSLTLAELFIQSFIIPFHEWCNRNGTLSRYQAYGHPWLYTDLIDGNLIPDIPEGDQWLYNGAWQPYADVDQIRYAIWNKYASSAGHLAGRKIISTEAMTNTSGVFKASLKYIKQATDLNIATGINHQVLHGFNYSPPEAGFPGWIRYGCYFNENNPWWQYMPKWSLYSARLSDIFQKSTPVSQVAIMGPTLDIWSDYGLDRNPFNLQPWYLHSLWQSFNHLGFGSDFVNSTLLRSARLEGGNILIGEMKYELLVLCELETIEPEAAQKIEELTIQGARIILIGKKPHRSPNMIGALKNDGIVRKAVENALGAGILVAPSPEVTLQKSPDKLMAWADQLVKNSGLFPLVEFSNPSAQLFQMHHKKQDVDILFICNVDRKKAYETEIYLGQNTSHAAKWNPETGSKNRLPLNRNDRIQINLAPLESALIIADKKETLSTSTKRKPKESSIPFNIAGPWNVTLLNIDKNSQSTILDEIKLINEIKGYENFGGEINYETTFDLERDDYGTLVIEEVNETAEVSLNGNVVGLSWYGNNHFDVTGNVKKGENKLKIKVTTVLANFVASLDHNETAQYWISRYKDKSQVKCGIAGKLTLR